jgi:hypothetical protein
MSDLLNTEMVEVAFDYLALHRQCWRLLTRVRDACRSDLARMYGPQYMMRPSELPSVVGYVLMANSGSHQCAEQMKLKAPVAGAGGVSSKLLEMARGVVRAMVESGECAEASARVFGETGRRVEMV